jgi:hypothetical protein
VLCSSGGKESAHEAADNEDRRYRIRAD